MSTFEDPAALWSHPLVAVALGDSFHPGGTALTLEMVQRSGLEPGAHILDLGCGRGASAAALAAQGFHVEGVDVSAANLEVAQQAAPGCSFRAIDPDLADLGGPYDAVLSECSLCLTASPQATLQQVREALRPGGSLLLSDVTVEEDAAAFRSAAGFSACLGGAMPVADLLAEVAAAGFSITWQRDCRDELVQVRDGIRSRVDIDAVLAELAGTEVARLVEEAEKGFAAGAIGYRALVATLRPAAQENLPRPEPRRSIYG